MIDPNRHYEGLKGLLLRLLRVPPEPEDPMGDVGTLKVFRASPGYFKYKLYPWLLGKAVECLIAIAASVGLAVALGPAGLLLDLLLLTLVPLHILLGYLTLRLDYEMRWYKVTDRSLRIREGVWFVREMTMTFANIQNISVEQGPLQRFFGIADMKVRSAGGGSLEGQEGGGGGVLFNPHVGYFRGVDNAEEIRDLILARLRRLRGAGLGDEDEDEAPAAAPAAATPASGELEAIAAEAAALRRAAEALAPAG
jgi:membrane protein YdbS with pleckstrin-like domain